MGIIGFFVDATNADAARYYKQFGFIPLPDSPLNFSYPCRLSAKLLVQGDSSYFHSEVAA